MFEETGIGQELRLDVSKTPRPEAPTSQKQPPANAMRTSARAPLLPTDNINIDVNIIIIIVIIITNIIIDTIKLQHRSPAV